MLRRLVGFFGPAELMDGMAAFGLAMARWFLARLLLTL